MTKPINYNREFMRLICVEIQREKTKREAEYVSGYLRRPLRSLNQARKERQSHNAR